MAEASATMTNPQDDDFSDLIELGINDNDEVDQKFEKCAKFIQSAAGTLDSEVLLKFYGLYKQSLEGPCTVSKPRWYDLKAKAKWESWKSLSDLNNEEAKFRYINLALEMNPNLFSAAETNKKSKKNDCWVSVSCMAQAEDEKVGSTEVNFNTYIQNNDVPKILKYLENFDAKKLDENGMNPIHHAADFGNLEILKLLIEKGYNINIQDSEGQTALHYASSCGYLNCVNFLLKNGANPYLKDSDGFSSIDVANDDSVRRLF